MAGRAGIPTKLGQDPTSSPRTTENNRRRLGTLFSSLSLGSSISGSIFSSSTLSSTSNAGGMRVRNETPTKNVDKAGGWLSWLTPTKEQDGEERDDGIYDKGEGEKFRGFGHDTNRLSRRTSLDSVRPIDLTRRNIDGPGSSLYSSLENLPDEILVNILLQLPPSTQQLLSLSLISKRFYSLSQSFELWSRLFDVTPGFKLIAPQGYRFEAVDCPPGRWSGNDFIPKSGRSREKHNESSRSIPIHYPTLYRSRLELQRTLLAPAPTGSPTQAQLRAHVDSVYCVHLASPWVVTGSRDKSIRFWRLDNLDLDGGMTAMTGQTNLVKTIERAHEGSVLSVRFEMDQNESGGILVTGSSDVTAGVWRVDFPSNAHGDIRVERIGTLKGHTGGVLDVALGRTRIGTCSKDTTIRIYDRNSLAHLHTMTGHTMPINCLAVDPVSLENADNLASASSDGHWIIWDMTTGEELRRGAGDSRGLACITWAGPYILTGDTDRIIKIFSSADASLLRTISGHTDLVRSLSVDLNHRIIVSGSYDNSVRICDVDTGELVRRIRDVHTSSIFGVATERGRVVSVSHDSTVSVTTYGPELPYRGLFL